MFRVFGISGLSASFLPKMFELAQAILAGKAKYLDAILGFSTLALLLILKHSKIRKMDKNNKLSTIIDIIDTYLSKLKIFRSPRRRWDRKKNSEKDFVDYRHATKCVCSRNNINYSLHNSNSLPFQCQ